MNTLDDFDDVLIDNVYQPLSHKTQRFCGLTCFSLSRALLFVYMAAQVLQFNYDASKDEGFRFDRLIVTALVVVSLFLRSHMAESSCQTNLRAGFANPYRIEWKIIPRCVIMVISLFVIPLLLSSIMVGRIEAFFSLTGIMSIVSIEYLISCTPLPPGKSKCREMWESFKEKLICDEGELAPEPA